MAEGIEAIRRSAARAALNPALWPETLLRVSRAVGGDMTLLEHVYKADGAVEIGFTDRPDLAAENRDAYERHFGLENPRWELARRMPLGALLHDDLIGDDRELGRHAYYVDFLSQSGLKYFVGTPLADDSEQTVILSLQRLADRGRAGRDELALFAGALPELRNAVAMYLRMVRGRSGAPLAAALDGLSDPFGIVDSRRRLHFANRALEALSAAEDLVALRDGRLVGTATGLEAALAEAIRMAVRGVGLGLAATRMSALGRLIVRVAPLGPADAQACGAGAQPLYCLMLDAPGRPNWRGIEAAMRLFGLTRREAVVGSHLAAGLGIDGCAARLGVSRNTVRTHLAMLREKLGVHNAIEAAAEMRRAIGPLG